MQKEDNTSVGNTTEPTNTQKAPGKNHKAQQTTTAEAADHMEWARTNTRPKEPTTPTTKALRKTAKRQLAQPSTACTPSTQVRECTCECSSGTPPPHTSPEARRPPRQS